MARPLQVKVRPMLRNRCPVCLSCLSVTLVYRGQTFGCRECKPGGFFKTPGLRVWRHPNPGSRVPGFNHASPAAGSCVLTVSIQLVVTCQRQAYTICRFLYATRRPAVNGSKLKQYELYEHDIVYMYITHFISVLCPTPTWTGQRSLFKTESNSSTPVGCSTPMEHHMEKTDAGLSGSSV